jgi:hypothetical protein
MGFVHQMSGHTLFKKTLIMELAKLFVHFQGFMIDFMTGIILTPSEAPKLEGKML